MVEAWGDSGSGMSSGALGLDEDAFASSKSNFARLESGSNEEPSSLPRFLSDAPRHIHDKARHKTTELVETIVRVSISTSTKVDLLRPARLFVFHLRSQTLLRH